MDASTRRALFGTEQPVEPALELQAGPLSLRLRGTRLLAIRAGGYEVWHGVAFLFRDPDWGTPEPVVDDLRHDTVPGGFRVDLRAHIPLSSGIDLRIHIEGDATGWIRYEGTAVPRSDVATHRTGLCLMHPASVAGAQATVLHADGRHSVTTFPELIAPWPPFMGVRGIRHEFASGAWAEARLEGDVFELEDQRNNADDSFKTYSRSNMMPRPYLLLGGVPVRQSVELRLCGDPPGHTPPTPCLPRPAAWRPFPGLALALEARDCAEVVRRMPALPRISPMSLHLILDSPGDEVDWDAVSALLQACAGGLRLDVCGLGDAAGVLGPLARLAGQLSESGIQLSALAVFPGTAPVLAAARSAFPGCPIGSGTPFFFTQLNRLDDLGGVDFLCFGTSALVHGADDESVMHGLRSLPAMKATLAVAHPGKPLRVGPCGIGARRSPLGRQPRADRTSRLALARHDPRSQALFGAAWLVGLLAQWAQAGAQSISLLDLPEPQAPAFQVLGQLQGATRVGLAGLVADGCIAVLDVEADGMCRRLLAHLGTEQDTELPAELLQGVRDTGSGALLMDAESWRAGAEAGASGPWRRIDPSSAPRRLPPCAVAVLELTAPD